MSEDQPAKYQTTLPPGDFGEVLGLLRLLVHRAPNGEIHVSYREARDLRPHLPQLAKWILEGNDDW